MKLVLRLGFLATLLVCSVLSVPAQQSKKAGVVDRTELKSMIPTTYFFNGQLAPVQLRNSAAIRLPDGKLVLAGLVDNSGYASEVAQKFQGFFITETKLGIEDSTLSPGQYGFGFDNNGKFHIIDVAGNDVLTVSSRQDEALTRPTPLQITQSGGNYRLYAGKKYVELKTQ